MDEPAMRRRVCVYSACDDFSCVWFGHGAMMFDSPRRVVRRDVLCRFHSTA